MSKQAIGHTPGPWIVLEVSAHEWQVGAKPQTPEYEYAEHVAVARVQSWDGEPPREQVVHNAYLIAAAPELLEALKGLSDMYTHAWDVVGGGLLMSEQSVEKFEAVHAAAVAAIAKATEPR